MTRILAALLVFGISFGYLEAAVVVYLRALYDPVRERLHPGRAQGELFPLITAAELAATGAENTRRLGIEIGREAATILMLAGFALLAGSNFHERLATMAVAFGLWDIFFYVFLRCMIHWPESLFTWDILFLLPLPWAAPVLAPMIVSATMILCGLYSLSFGGIPPKPWQWVAMIAGGLVVIWSFMWDARNTMAGGLPNPFNWPLFAAGEALALAGFAAAIRNPKYRGSRKPRGS